jgi:hypothetical protein
MFQPALAAGQGASVRLFVPAQNADASLDGPLVSGSRDGGLARGVWTSCLVEADGRVVWFCEEFICLVSDVVASGLFERLVGNLQNREGPLIACL